MRIGKWRKIKLHIFGIHNYSCHIANEMKYTILPVPNLYTLGDCVATKLRQVLHGSNYSQLSMRYRKTVVTVQDGWFLQDNKWWSVVYHYPTRRRDRQVYLSCYQYDTINSWHQHFVTEEEGTQCKVGNIWCYGFSACISAWCLPDSQRNWGTDVGLSARGTRGLLTM